MAPRLCLIILGNYITTRSYRLANNCYAPATQQWRSIRLERIPLDVQYSSVLRRFVTNVLFELFIRFQLKDFKETLKSLNLSRSIALSTRGFEYLSRVPIAPTRDRNWLSRRKFLFILNSLTFKRLIIIRDSESGHESTPIGLVLSQG